MSYIVKLSTRDGSLYLANALGGMSPNYEKARQFDDWADAAKVADKINADLEEQGEPKKAADKTRYSYVVKYDIEKYIRDKEGARA